MPEKVRLAERLDGNVSASAGQLLTFPTLTLNVASGRREHQIRHFPSPYVRISIPCGCGGEARVVWQNGVIPMR